MIMTKLRFDKYTSIENTYQVAFMLKVNEVCSPDLIWDVTEKVHGANFCFITDGTEIMPAKRSGILQGSEGFFNYQLVLARNQQKFLDAFKYVKEKYETEEKPVKYVQFYGELFGGYYPHKDVKPDPQYSMVQKEIFYAPYQEFYGFDIAICHGNGADQNGFRTWLNPDQEMEVYHDNDIFYARSLFRGTLKECLEYSNMFPTTIPGLLGLPPIEGNICEGVVLKPMIPQFFGNGQRIVLKNKNAKFAEKKADHSHKEIKELPAIVTDISGKVCNYITENRLNNVISHEGEFNIPKEFGKLMGFFVKDIIDDFSKENEELWSQLEKKDRGAINKIISYEAGKIIKQHYHMV